MTEVSPKLLKKKIKKEKKKAKEIKLSDEAKKPMNIRIEFEEDEEMPNLLEKIPENMRELEEEKKDSGKNDKQSSKKDQKPKKLSKTDEKEVNLNEKIDPEPENIKEKRQRFNSLAICFPDSIIALHQVNKSEICVFRNLVIRVKKLFRE